MKKIFITLLLGFISTIGFSQGATDALRYSTIYHNGDARFMSMGGAFGAVGGNISSFNLNPAGIGLYRRSDASATISIIKIKNATNYNAELSNMSGNDFLINQVGFVITNNYLEIPTEGEWKNFQIGFSYNTLKNFKNQIYISGPNTANSIGDMYAELAYGLTIDDIENDGANAFDLTPAWFSYLFDESTTPGSYLSAAPPGGVQQSKLIDSWGSLNEFALTFGGNYGDKLYVGATIGIPILNYHEIATYSEDALEASIPDDTYRSVLVKDYLDTKARGINLKLGLIYKANDMIRLGAAFHTPTYYYDIQDEWRTRVVSDWDDFDSELNDSPTGYYEYHLSTPMKAIGSVAFVFNKFGLISFDYEYVDYASAKLKSDDYSFDTENDDIKTAYQATSNIRIGTEWKLANFAFRGGYSLYGSPYKNDGDNGERSSYSLGIGYRDGNYYMDAAWVHTETKDDHYMYGYNGVVVNPATINNKKASLLFTFGLRF